MSGADEFQIKNAIIESATITREDGPLTAWLTLHYGASGQGFGGHALYLPKTFNHHEGQANYAGHFIFRVMEIADVSRWEDLVGKTIRVRSSWSRIEAIGHIVKDDWFNPHADFESLNAEKKAAR